MALNLTPYQQAHYADTRQPALYGSMGTFLFVSTGAFLARIFCQWRSREKLLVEEIFLGIAVILADTTAILYIVGTYKGLGLHIFRVIDEDPNPPHLLTQIYAYVWTTSVIMVGCLGSIKLALLFMYRRLFLVDQKWLVALWWANVIYLLLWVVGSWPFYIAQCSPVQYYWTRFYPAYNPKMYADIKGSCLPTTGSAVTATLSLNVFSDAALLSLPLATIWTLQMSSRKKLGLLIVFGFGLLAFGVSIARIITVRNAAGAGQRQDATYNIIDFLILTAAEETVGIVCACWPIIVPAVTRYIWRKKSGKPKERSPGTSAKPFGALDDPSPGSSTRRKNSPNRQEHDEYSLLEIQREQVHVAPKSVP